MAEHFSFFDAVLEEDGVTYDREYNAQQFTKYFGALVTTGVMKGMGNMLAVSANGSNMVTQINTGIAFIEGKYYENDNPLSLTHDTETLGNSRIDRIVIRMDLATEARYVKSFIKKGVPSTNPVAPALTQTANYYEISLAQVRIVGGQTFIATNAVTDERGKDVICPWAGSKILPNFDDNALAMHINDLTKHASYAQAETTDGRDYYATVPQIDSYVAGLRITIFPLQESSSTSVLRLDINGLGLKNIIFQNGIAASGDAIMNWMPITLVYNGGHFVIQGVYPKTSSLGYTTYGDKTLATANAVKQVNDKLDAAGVTIPLNSPWSGSSSLYKNGKFVAYVFEIWYNTTIANGIEITIQNNIPTGYKPTSYGSGIGYFVNGSAKYQVFFTFTPTSISIVNRSGVTIPSGGSIYAVLEWITTQ